MKMIETYRGVVYPHHIDHMGHMNVQWYTSRFDQATWHLMAAIGITLEYINKQNKGMAAVEQTTKYKTEVVSGELLLVKSKVNGITDKVIKFQHIMYNSETMQEVASTELVAVHIDRGLRKSSPLPANVINRCTDLFDLSESK